MFNPPRKRGRPPRADAEKAIVEAATTHFLECGYSSATMQDIARQCGASKQTIYARFPTKIDLFRGVVSDFLKRKLGPALVGLDMSRQPDELLHRLAHLLLISALDHETIAMQKLVIAEKERVPELAEILMSETSTPSLELIESIMATLVDRSDIKGHPRDLAVWFFDLVLTRHVRDALFRPIAEVTDEMLNEQKKAIGFFLQLAATRDPETG